MMRIKIKSSVSVIILLFSFLFTVLYKSEIYVLKHVWTKGREKLPNDFYNKSSSDYITLKSFFGDAFMNDDCNISSSMSSVQFSQMFLDKNNSDEINGEFSVTIVTYDFRNVRKFVGGDSIVIWAEQQGGDGRSPGSVVDNKDGSYTGKVTVIWSDKTFIKAKITGTAEMTCLKLNALKRYGNMVYALKKPLVIYAKFNKRNKEERTRCGPSSYIYGYDKVCNLTDINGYLSWYCGKPEILSCGDISAFISDFDTASDIPLNSLIQTQVHGVLSSSVLIQSNRSSYLQPNMKCTSTPKTLSWQNTAVSGYRLKKTWNQLYCSGNIYKTTTEYRDCLKGKTVIAIGDSTVRQYIEYFCNYVLDLKFWKLKRKSMSHEYYHPFTTYNAFNITMMYRKHEMPFHAAVDLGSKGIKSMPQIITDIGNSDVPGESLIILVNYYAHLQAYQPSEFRRRLSQLAETIRAFLKVKLRTTFLFKGPHLVVTNSRWFDTKFAFLYRDILFEEFHDLMDKVVYLDVWAITVAHNSEDLHPENSTFQSHIDQFMSFVCE